ncbi:ATP-binding protein [Candidatus Paracaedibacter symbiosus]|uniref:ATP-binding protein n=1 Tax=Candidatus Paracaedibacter symbiosus TaxID=244582 RepID=UPI000509C273|nr:ATP-binding protein [Candidatus Paracaedibacter symbiosus]
MSENFKGSIINVNEQGIITSASENFFLLTGQSESAVLGKNIAEFIVKKLDEEQNPFPAQVYLEQIIENIGAVIWLCSLDVKEIYYASPSFEKCYEITVEDYVKGLSVFLNRVHPDDLESFMRIYDISQGFLIREFDFRYLLNDGSWRYLSVYRFPVYDENGNFSKIAGVSIDNTNLYKAQEEMQRQQQKLAKTNEELNRMNELLEDFTAFACHDLSQPLRTVNAYTQILEAHYLQNIDDEGKLMLSSIYTAIHRMRTLIEGIRSLSLIREEPVKTSSVNIKDLIKKAIEPIYVAPPNSLCQIEMGELHPLHVKEEHVLSLLENLIENSVKYNNRLPRIKIRSKKFASFLVYTITDNGIGIPREAYEQIFKLGKRLNTKPEQLGTGIGLSACKKIMSLYGGKIWVHSKLDEGSTFYLLFPQSK